jgi:hypothetical protein
LILNEKLYTLDRSSAGFGHSLARIVRRRRRKRETTPTAETPPMRKSAAKAIRE